MEAKAFAEHQSLPTLAAFINTVIRQLRANKKHAAVRTYTSTRNSFLAFAAAEAAAQEAAEAAAEAEAEAAAEAATEEVVIPPAAPAAATAPDHPAASSDDPLSLASVFTPGRLKAYETWLRGRGKKWNTVSTYMRTLQAVYNRIHAPGSYSHNPTLFDDVYTKVESLTKRALSEQQANALMEADLELLPEEVRGALAYFLLMLYFRGMPFIDLAYLRKQDLSGDTLVYCRHKTGRQIKVRLSARVRALFEQFCDRNPRSTYLFPILDPTLRGDAAIYAYYQKALRRFNKQLQALSAILLPGVKISSYTSRHTWATIAFHHNVPIGIISKALGHSSVKVTETYLMPFKDREVDAANDELLDLVARWNEKEHCIKKIV